MAGGPDSKRLCLWAWASWREYHCGTSRESIEWRRVPQVRCWNLGLGVDVSFRGVCHAGGTAALLRVVAEAEIAGPAERRRRRESLQSIQRVVSSFSLFWILC